MFNALACCWNVMSINHAENWTEKWTESGKIQKIGISQNNKKGKQLRPAQEKIPWGQMCLSNLSATL